MIIGKPLENMATDVKQTGKKSIEPGVIYLSRIPPLMNVKKIKEVFGQYGDVGRVFLQPDEKAYNSKKGRYFTEGWVEFLNKRNAKQVAAALNNTQIGGKKRSRWYDEMWNMKYLHRFKWGHLNERLAYEKAVHQQRLRTEISQVKREANYYIRNAEKSKKMKSIEDRKIKQGKTEEIEENEDKSYEFTQRNTEEEILHRKRKTDDVKCEGASKKSKSKHSVNKKSVAAKSSFLKNIFSGGVSDNEESGD